MEIDLNTPAIRARVAKELAKRMHSGVFIYPILWFIVGIGGDLHNTTPLLFWAAFIAFLVLTTIRTLHIRLISQLSESEINTWLLQLRLLMLPHCILWGCLLGYSLTEPNTHFILLMTFSSAGIVPGGIYNFAPDLKLSLSFVLSILLPAIISSLLFSQQWFFFFLLLVYTLYISFMAYSQYRDYWKLVEKQFILEEQSRTDALTQLDNRRHFDEKLDEFCHMSSRNHEQLSVMLVDCDLFKNVNDTYGHDIGDQCLKHIAKLLKKALPRTTDVCARYGGEEFSIILAGTNIDGAKLVGERIRQLIESNPFTFDNNRKLEVTVSIGSVSQRIQTFVPELPFDLFKQADKALYRAKENGRNQCVYFNFNVESDTYEFVGHTPAE